MIARWISLLPLLLLLAGPARAVVSAGCNLFGADTKVTPLQNWPYDAVRLQVAWRPLCLNFTCVAPPMQTGANVRQSDRVITVDVYGTDEALPPSVSIVPSNSKGPVDVDVGPLTPGIYTVQGTVFGVTGGIATDLCNGPRTFTTLTVEAATAPVQRQIAIEFYNEARDHYFISSDRAEIAMLDAGTHPGWKRTGKSFAVFAPGKSGGVGVPVCRFYGAPDAGLDSHFYTADAAECAALPGRFGGAWTLETADAFEVRLPNAELQCAGGFVAISRFWNRRADSNHRYTTDPDVAARMRNKGWAEEGIMCSPP